ncbi:MAG: hypothetical protein WAX04_09900, partial [Oscillospiraceae bacterium]
MLTKYYQDLATVKVNTMANRAYYIPCSNNNLTEQKQDNHRILMLNGKWDFKLYESIADFSFEVNQFYTIDVPSNWQMLGYDNHQ